MKEILNLPKHALNFFIPIQRGANPVSDGLNKKVVALIPTYKPTVMCYKLVSYIHVWNPNVKIIVVDDHSPFDLDSQANLSKIQQLSQLTPQVELIHTPENRLKAGALNYGLNYIKESGINPDVVITFDDDVIIQRDTISTLVNSLYADPNTGAACTQAHVVNKNVNLLTRMQGLEYHGFNILKLADNGFLQGPLVMQGMLTAFKYEAISQVGGFTVGHLIEDYDITTRLKKQGWNVQLVSQTIAHTDVPENLNQLWKQRIRWTYGGLFVLKDSWRYLPAVLQDFVGHSMFLIMAVLIGLSFIVPSHGQHPEIATVALYIALSQFAISFIFNAIAMLEYKEADFIDWAIRFTLIPEVAYNTVMSLLLVGCYLFFAYNSVFKRIVRVFPQTEVVYVTGLKLFNQFGYTASWGTRKEVSMNA